MTVQNNFIKYQPENFSERSSLGNGRFETINQEIYERDYIIKEYEQQLELITQ